MPFGPSSPVRTIVTYTSFSPAPEMNCFEPVTIQSSPSRTARVFSAAASEPDPGSVRQ